VKSALGKSSDQITIPKGSRVEDRLLDHATLVNEKKEYHRRVATQQIGFKPALNQKSKQMVESKASEKQRFYKVQTFEAKQQSVQKSVSKADETYNRLMTSMAPNYKQQNLN
jgi:hypothetical protein